MGKSVVNAFKTSSWKITNIDLMKNKDATQNIIVQKTYDRDLILNIHKQIKTNFDCVINVAGGWRGEQLKHEEIVIVSEIMFHQNTLSAVLAAHLAKKFMNKNGLLVLTGANSVKDNYNANMIAYQLAKNSVHYLTEILDRNPQELPENSKIITLLPY